MACPLYHQEIPAAVSQNRRGKNLCQQDVEQYLLKGMKIWTLMNM
jgi:hypothetical protein